MNIKIKFITKRTPYWENRIIENAAIASSILSDPAFWDEIGLARQFDLTDKTAAQISQDFLAPGDIEIRVGFYSKLFTRAIAYESGGDVFFNTRKSAGSPGNIGHEICHVLKYSHHGNSARGNENSVPYVVGNQIDKWVKSNYG